MNECKFCIDYVNYVNVPFPKLYYNSKGHKYEIKNVQYLTLVDGVHYAIIYQKDKFYKIKLGRFL